MGYTGKQPAVTVLTGADIAPGSIENSDLAGSITDDKISNLSASKLTGSVADARIPASAVTQHVTATNLAPIENDVAILALQNAINGSMTAHGLNNYWIEQFEDSNSITALTNCSRDSSEFITTISSDYGVTSDTLLLIESNTSNGSTTFTDSSNGGRTVTAVGNAQHSTTQKKIGASSIYLDGSGDAVKVADSNDWAFSGDFTIDVWFYCTDFSHVVGQAIIAFGPDGPWSSLPCNVYIDVGNNMEIQTQMSNNGGTGITLAGPNNTVTQDAWQHLALTRSGNDFTLWHNGVSNATVNQSITIQNYAGDPHFGMRSSGYSHFKGYLDNIRVTNSCLWTSNFTPPTQTANATGSFTSTTITPQDSASKNSLGLCLLYKNNAGTNTLNTDIVAQVSCDNGSNYSTCVLASKGTFSTGINIAIAPAISCTAGTQLKYKISFANQASGSKEGQIHGVALSY